jgi:hypothetical protein
VRRLRRADINIDIGEIDMYCKKCGRFVGDGFQYKFCWSCGANVERTQSNSQYSQYSNYNHSYNANDVPPPECPPEEQTFLVPENPEDDDFVPRAQIKKEEFFFGRKALMFCLVIIAI